MFNQRTNYVANDQFISKNGRFEKWVPAKDWSINDGIQFRLIDSGESPESGVQSPPLWKNNSPPEAESPASRIQAIVKGQKELMDMVKKMPESNYELTLKDLVEEQETNLGNSQEEVLLQEMNSTRQENNKKIDGRRWNGMENKGLLVFPIFGMKSRKKKSSSSNLLKSSSSAKISPKPEGCDNKTSKNGDKDWLRKIFSTGSDCSRSSSHSTKTGSTRSSSSSSSIRTRRFFSCISCFKAAE